MIPLVPQTYSAGAPLVAFAAFLALAVPARADQTAGGTPIGSVVEEAPPRDIDSYTLIEILDSHDPHAAFRDRPESGDSPRAFRQRHDRA